MPRRAIALLLFLVTACGGSSESDTVTVGLSFSITDSAGRVHKGASTDALWFGPDKGFPDTTIYSFEAETTAPASPGGFPIRLMVVAEGPGFTQVPADVTLPIRTAPYPRVGIWVDSAFKEWQADSGSVRVTTLQDTLLQFEMRARLFDTADSLGQPVRLRARLVARPTP